MNKKVLAGVVIAIIVAAGLVVFVAGKDSQPTTVSKQASETSSMEHESSKNSTEENADSTNKVAIENFVYTPQRITIKVGTTVTWTNQDSVGHTVTADDDQEGPDSELLSQGQSYSFTYTKTGTFSYHCAPHPNMTGVVEVTE